MNAIRQNISIEKYQNYRLGKEIFPGCNLVNLSPKQAEKLKENLWENGVIFVRNQNLTASQLTAFARQTFRDSNLGHRRPKSLDPEIPAYLQSSGSAILGNPKGLSQNVLGKIAWQWHHDKDLLPKTAGLEMNTPYVVMLYGVTIPSEGIDGQPHTTGFLDMIKAYNNFEPEYQQQLEQLSMYHLSPVSPQPGEEIPRKLHPLVSTHQITGRKGLYLGSDTSILQGLEDKPDLAKRYWVELFEKALNYTPIYHHVWQAGDIVFWDNSQVMHTGKAYDSTKYKRIALRIGVVNNRDDYNC
ncbi:MAG: TauD/TfdA family dioxygenase [Okeania sp. SIO2G4]|uniref:TauD/TfdA dioxygenase family protein n=1 Tax=unclassified Okeania TaxID=2634635 RepID=UPI0013B8D859|nr:MULTISPECIES: TauD/TfdA family dioxygenase [unclassified Okeania]NEP08087.1 TauD/TfdA family dioxygenase [Okeania sp. SIO4D6]NEP73048.1 TauD/TfdA family dioxygenase [Okeania sp. SIO2G5]NEP93911.1 TauD/TfdA family dioxygenase [Okeania sp. SIO2F5]NEQ91733.1 TauD/TfdA family dioxygenase [Okeania sp. SIO2G4]